MSEYRGITIIESLEERLESVGWAGLTVAERECLCANCCIDHIANGAMLKFLLNGDPWLQQGAVDGLRRIGAPALAGILERAMAIFPNGTPPATLAQRMAALRDDRDDDFSTTASLTDEFWEAYEREDGVALIERYVEAHPAEFHGPRDAEALWAARKTRGVELPPERLAELARMAETDAAFTDERCAACGQPLPGYRKTCKRCGRPRSING